VSYRFDPSEDDDGVTSDVPLALLPQLDPEASWHWTIRGWHRAEAARVAALQRKALRQARGR
jgi:hypothetical protein